MSTPEKDVDVSIVSMANRVSEHNWNINRVSIRSKAERIESSIKDITDLSQRLKNSCVSGSNDYDFRTPRTGSLTTDTNETANEVDFRGANRLAIGDGSFEKLWFKNLFSTPPFHLLRREIREFGCALGPAKQHVRDLLVGAL